MKFRSLTSGIVLAAFAPLASAGPVLPPSALSLSVLGPAIGDMALPGTGIQSFGVPDVAGIALAAKNYDGAGHSLVGLKLKTGGVPEDVEHLPGLPGDSIHFGVVPPPAPGPLPPHAGENVYKLDGIAKVTLTLPDEATKIEGAGLGIEPAPVP